MRTLALLATLLAPVEGKAPPEAVLTGTLATENFEIRFRPGSRAEADADRAAVFAERDLAAILERFELKSWKRQIRLFLYDDVADLQQVTGVGAGGFSTTLQSHVPANDDQTRFHELVHVVAEFFPERGDEPRNLFFSEGLANAALEFVHGLHVDVVAAFYLERGELPGLEEIAALPDFYAWLSAHPGVNGYDIAGSFMKFLLDQHGAKAVRAFAKGVPARTALRAQLADVERAWHAHLKQVQIRPGARTLLEQRAGGPPRSKERPPLTDEDLGPAGEWQDVAIDVANGASGGAWTALKAGASGTAPTSDADWRECRADRAPLGDCMARVTATPVGECFGVKLQLGHDCQALLLRNGAFIYTEVGGIAFDGATALGSVPVDIVLERRGGRARVWFGGRLVLESEIASAPAPLAVGVVSGTAKFTELRVRELR